MAASDKATYTFMYDVTRNADGSYSIDRGAPAAKTVKFNSNSSDVAPADEIKIRSAGNGLNGNYDYIGSVTTSTGDTGYIVYNGVSQQYFMLTNTKFSFAGHPNLSLGNADTTGANSQMPVCFMAGTRISTLVGAMNVESLKVGDFVLTSDGRPVPIRWIGHQTVARLFADELSLPVRIRAGALDENVPSRDLMVSHEHGLFVDGILIQAGALINGTSIVRELDVPNTFVYYHVEVEDHSLIMAENAVVETFVDNVDRARFDNWHEYEALYPAVGKNIEELPYPRAKAHRQVPMHVRARLADRAQAIDMAAKVTAA